MHGDASGEGSMGQGAELRIGDEVGEPLGRRSGKDGRDGESRRRDIERHDQIADPMNDLGDVRFLFVPDQPDVIEQIGRQKKIEAGLLVLAGQLFITLWWRRSRSYFVG